MRRNYWMAAVAALLLSGSAFANDMGMDKDHKREPVNTRQENIARVKERLAKLEAMSDADWNAKHAEMKKRHEGRMAHIKEKREASPTAGKPVAESPAEKKQ